MMIETTHGPMDEAELRKHTGGEETEDYIESWVEYWVGEELVHRSVHLQYKKTLAELLGQTS